MVGNLTKKNKKCQMPGGQPGGGAWTPLELTRTLISVKRCVHKQGTVVPKLLTIGQGAKI